MALTDDPAPSRPDDAGQFAVTAPACTRIGEAPAHGGVTVILPDPGGDHALAAVLEHVPESVDELLLLERGTGSGDGRVLQRAGFAAARNDCIVMVGPGADLPAMGRFVDALRAGAAGAAGPRPSEPGAASVLAASLDRAAVSAVDGTAQAGAMLALGHHVRDALGRVEAAGLRATPARAVVLAGMGGSAVGGRLAVGALGERARRPVVVVDGYDLPVWVDEDVLVLCSSYSGGTEETLACYDAARRNGAAVVAATTGGELARRARRDDVPVIDLPAGLQPRAAVGYSLVCALEAACAAGAAPSQRAELDAAAASLDELRDEWGPDGPQDGEAKLLAARLHGTAPVIVGAGLTAPVAYRWKCQCNENAKIPAFSSSLPEADHNEICGWAASGEFGRFSAVFLEASADRPELARRMELTAGLAASGAHGVHRVAGRGSGRLPQLLSLVLLGDLVSLYLSVLRGTDPVEIDAIRTLKAALSGP
jgi:glucose/mannose-6-phosphate isomerase